MRKITGMIMTLLMLMMLLVSIVSASDLIGIENGKIVGEPVNEPSWWYSLWHTKAISFVDTTAVQANSVCTKVYTSSELAHLGGSSRPMGASCSEGQYVAFTVVSGSTDGNIVAGRYLFDKLWYISSSTDVIASTNYYFHQSAFTYKYECFTCAGASTTDTEPGCLSTDGTKCVTKSSSSCKTWYGYESVCLTHTSSSGSSGTTTPPATTTEPKIQLGDLKVSNDGNLVQGKTYEIKGMAYVTGEMTGAIIETGFTGEYFQALTVTSTGTGKGVCGDDLTTGVKFTAKDTWVVFTLPIKPTTVGKQRLKIIASPGCGSGIISDAKYVELNVVAPTGDSGTVDVPPGTGGVDCTNDINAIACAPPACTGIECNLDVCNDNCSGDSDVVTDPNKPAPSWINPWTVGFTFAGILVLAGLYITLVPKKGRKHRK